jgi:predicted nucleic acid-binding protein
VIVVDASILVYLFVAGVGSARAERVLRNDPAWAAPLLWRSEFRNAVLGIVRRRGLPRQDGVQAMREAEAWMRGREYAVVSDHVFELALSSGCSAYDCEYVAAAVDLGVSLVTSDRQVLSAFPRTAVSPDAM